MALSTMSAGTVQRSAVSTSRPSTSRTVAKVAACTRPASDASDFSTPWLRIDTPLVCAHCCSWLEAGICACARR